MPVYINNTWVASSDDIQNLQSEIASLRSVLDRVNNRMESIASQANQRLSSLEKDMQQQGRQITNLTETIRLVDQELRGLIHDLDNEITSMVGEINRSETLISTTNEYLAQNNQKVEAILDANRLHLDARAAQRKELSDKLEELLARNQSQLETLQATFKAIQDELGSLSKAEQEGAKQVDRSIRQLREAVIQVQSQTQDDLANTANTILGFTQRKEERSKEELALLDRILAAQAGLGQTMQRIQQTAGEMGRSSGESSRQQASLLQHELEAQASELNNLAVRLVQDGKAATALPLLEKAVQLTPTDASIQANLAQVLVATGRLEDAGKVLQAMLSQPECPSGVYLQQGWVLLDQNQPAEAVSFLEQTIQKDPSNPAAWLALGQARYRLGEVELALAAWQRCALLDPSAVQTDPTIRILLEEQSLEGERL